MTGLVNADQHPKSPDYLPNFVRTNAKYTYEMSNPFLMFNKPLVVLKHRQNGNLMDMSMYLGFFGQSSFNWTDSNIDGQSFYNTLRGSTKQSGTNFSVDVATLGFTATLGSWVSGYAELGYSDNNPGGLDVGQALVVLGDLNKNPVYGSIGRGFMPFGNFESLAGINDRLLADYFQPIGTNASVGYSDSGFDVTVTLARAPTVNSLSTNIFNTNGIGIVDSNKTNVDTVVVNARYMDSHQNGDWFVGAGYNNNGPFTMDLVNNVVAQNKNGAWDVNAGFTWDDFTVQAEWVSQTKKWKFEGTDTLTRKPYGYDIQAAYDFNFAEYDHRLALGYSQVEFNKAAAAGESQTKSFTAALVSTLHENVSAFVSYENLAGVKVPPNAAILGAGGSLDQNIDANRYAGNTELKDNRVTLGVRAVF
jgi:hypothetical protein